MVEVATGQRYRRARAAMLAGGAIPVPGAAAFTHRCPPQESMPEANLQTGERSSVADLTRGRQPECGSNATVALAQQVHRNARGLWKFGRGIRRLAQRRHEPLRGGREVILPIQTSTNQKHGVPSVSLDPVRHTGHVNATRWNGKGRPHPETRGA